MSRRAVSFLPQRRKGLGNLNKVCMRARSACRLTAGDRGWRIFGESGEMAAERLE